MQVNKMTGLLEAVGSPLALGGVEEGQVTGYIGASTTDRFALGDYGPDKQNELYPSGVGQLGFHGSFAIVTPETEEVQALAYSPTSLVAGQRGPAVEFIVPGDNILQAAVDLTQPPASLPAYNGEPNSDAVSSVLPIGPFVYVGVYGKPTVQLIAEAGHAVTFPEEVFAAGGANVSIDAMAGFVTAPIPSQEKPGPGPGEKTGEEGKKVGTAPMAIVLGGASKAKLKAGVIKLDVTCGLPCTVSGAVVPPGAKAAHAAPKALPFKSVHLPGSGKPATVTFKLTRAQRKLIAHLLRKHRKVVAKITVTEGNGGAAPAIKTVKLV